MKLQEIYTRAKQGNRREHARFMRDMKRAGLKMRYYAGRFYWKGAAVVCSDLQDVLSATKVRCTWDSMGRDYIVYPRQSL